MKVLIIGGGGREHAIVWKIAQSEKVEIVFCAPGNPGIEEIEKATSVNIKTDDISGLIDFVKGTKIDLTVVGPEGPLVDKIVNRFQKEGLPIFGPDSVGAQLEGSKIFAKDFMQKYGIPTAEYRAFSFYADAEKYVREMGAPIVIKADGLAGGKGVIVAETVQSAIDALKLIMLDKKFGDAGNKVIVEQYLKGEEASFMILTDGTTVVPLATSQDHKPEHDGDRGRNTGGMGAYSPAPVVTDALSKVIMQDIVGRILHGLKEEKIIYRGVIYVGLMICEGKPYVLEFNVRFGDPEAQPILMRLDSDLFELLKATSEGRLKDIEVRWKDEASVCVVLTAKGYPGTPEKGKVITGLDSFKDNKNIVIFHAGTIIKDDETVTSSGRVVGVTALGKDIKTAKENAYKAVEKIHFDGMRFRTDIGDKAIRKQ